MTIKIISGGQTGADIGALAGAKRAGFTTGGTAPKGWKTEKGPQPVLADYGLVQHDSDQYVVRTLINVKDADATVVFATNPCSRGTQQTIEFARKYNKPCICINPFSPFAIQQFTGFLNEFDISIVNVAGNRESRSKGISKQVADLVYKGLKELRLTT